MCRTVAVRHNHAVTTPNFSARRIDDLSARELHAVLQLRAAVFVVEQACAYQDPDATDLVAWHLLATDGGRLVGYARWWDADDGVHIGRVVTAGHVRGEGLGHAIVRECLVRIGSRRVVLHAQDHLRRFYAAHEFAPVGDVFLEDGIPHVVMVREVV
ncbi:MAG: GNAT family N-acetyltransferase [Planctomycetes bacterium]|nr:GNAT family N-acetyltransferase [Planctomycetota bacterium]